MSLFKPSQQKRTYGTSCYNRRGYAKRGQQPLQLTFDLTRELGNSLLSGEYAYNQLHWGYHLILFESLPARFCSSFSSDRLGRQILSS